ncbi:hypothetical protein FDECE_4124 [Fusarium decemcellulare]|nr:hypothetical protein FDECE_4124 [Fusarium decemcellulare]
MSDTDGPASAIRALRNTFGDTKPPDISRKITACVACRKQKMLLESDVVWKQSLEIKVQKLQDAIQTIVNHTTGLPAELIQQFQPTHIDDTPELSVHDGAGDDVAAMRTAQGNAIDDQSQQQETRLVSPSSSEHEDINPNQQGSHWGIVMDLESGPGDIPGFYMSRAPQTEQSSRSTRTQLDDIISRGIIGLENAQTYFDEYQNRLDHFPYRVLGDYTKASLNRIREASSLLTAAVCTVGALHCHSTPSSATDFDHCYQEFISEAAKQSFSKDCTADKVRALCIGAFWLGDLSWTLVGSAVRMATELQLHKSMAKALQGDRVHYLRSRLYLLVYACDHHFSIAFGRPPLTRECETIRNARRFLDCEHATEDDARLVSQVLRWSLCSNIFDTFGVHSDRPLSDAEVPHLRRFNLALDSLRAEWADSFSPNPHVGNYPRKGVSLQYHFAKLYLCSHAFRGAELTTSSRAPDAALGLEEVTSSAVYSASSIIRNVLTDTEMQAHLDGLPIYFDTMIAFAAVFLLKLPSNRFSEFGRPDMKEIRNLVEQLAITLKRVTSTMNPQHLLVRITKGIDGLLQRCQPHSLANTQNQGEGDGSQPLDLGVDPSSISNVLPNGGQDGQSNLLSGDDLATRPTDFDAWFMGEYDFLLDQHMDFSLDSGNTDGLFAPGFNNTSNGP